MEPKWNVKDDGTRKSKVAIYVLMEPKWNVKRIALSFMKTIRLVLMEPKWNVKGGKQQQQEFQEPVLMEPKWNVKYPHTFIFLMHRSINGTKVECKDVAIFLRNHLDNVLMEPKWNVKSSSLSSSVRLSSY